MTGALGAVAGDAVAYLVETAQLLDVNVQQLPRAVSLIGVSSFSVQ